MDLIDNTYNFMRGISDTLEKVYLAKFMNQDELYEEPEVGVGINMHGFYDIFEDSKAIYVLGDLSKSTLDEIVLFAKTIEKCKVREAAEACADLRRHDRLKCEVVEGVILETFGNGTWKMSGRYNCNGEGVGLASTDIAKVFLGID